MPDRETMMREGHKPRELARDTGMIGERELLTRSLPPEGPGWAEFEARFLGKKAGCPLTADLIELAQGQGAADTAVRLRRHFEECASCKNWFTAYRTGYEEPAASTLRDV